jgi:DNA-binding transcriptional MerR regulator/effector-binding domain-containing protein
MITIGDFARLGRVSVRMLRHYDSIGLLVPVRTDPHTGYRYYDITQLPRLNRIVALKDLGLRLEQVRQIVDDQLTGSDLRAMFRLRQAEIESQIRHDQYRLAQVEARLRLIEIEEDMSAPAVVTKMVAPTQNVGLRALAASATSDDIGPIIQPMYPQIIEALSAAGETPVGPSVAYYSPAPEQSEDALWVHATFPVLSTSVTGLETFEIPGGEVATLIHVGSMASIDSTYQTLNRWVSDQGFTLTGQGREIYLEMSEDESEWVTEVQVDFVR